MRDAAACAKALGLRYDIVPIAEPVEGVESARSAPLFAGRPRDITEENIQSRARGLILMSISNKFGAMVVTTGNKSEMSVGYATLYGDMNGGFNPIKDLYKMEVFRLCDAAQPLEARGRARAGRRRSFRRTSSPSRRRRNCARTRRTRIRCRPTPVARRHPASASSRRRCASPTSSPRATTSRPSRGRAAALSGRIQAPPVGAGRQGGAEEFRPRPPLSHRQSLPRSRPAAQAPDASIAPKGSRDERAVRGVAGPNEPACARPLLDNGGSRGRPVRPCFACGSIEGLLHRPVGRDDAQMVISEAARAVGRSGVVTPFSIRYSSRILLSRSQVRFGIDLKRSAKPLVGANLAGQVRAPPNLRRSVHARSQ